MFFQCFVVLKISFSFGANVFLKKKKNSTNLWEECNLVTFVLLNIDLY
jgi:hypothetical protein